jgi:hypothetical protein
MKYNPFLIRHANGAASLPYAPGTKIPAIRSR